MILLAASLQVCVQLIEGHELREAAPSGCGGSSRLLVAAGRITELALKAPVRTKHNETAGLLAAISAQHLLHRTLQVVVTQSTEHTAEAGKRKLMRLSASSTSSW